MRWASKVCEQVPNAAGAKAKAQPQEKEDEEEIAPTLLACMAGTSWLGGSGELPSSSTAMGCTSVTIKKGKYSEQRRHRQAHSSTCQSIIKHRGRTCDPTAVLGTRGDALATLRLGIRCQRVVVRG
jgi:hypothetical protein